MVLNRTTCYFGLILRGNLYILIFEYLIGQKKIGPKHSFFAGDENLGRRKFKAGKKLDQPKFKADEN